MPAHPPPQVSRPSESMRHVDADTPTTSAQAAASIVSIAVAQSKDRAEWPGCKSRVMHAASTRRLRRPYQPILLEASGHDRLDVGQAEREESRVQLPMTRRCCPMPSCSSEGQAFTLATPGPRQLAREIILLRLFMCAAGPRALAQPDEQARSKDESCQRAPAQDEWPAPPWCPLALSASDAPTGAVHFAPRRWTAADAEAVIAGWQIGVPAPTRPPPPSTQSGSNPSS